MADTADPATSPAPMGGVTPYLTVNGGAAAIDFYKAAFGAQEMARRLAEDGRRIMHAHLVINGGPLLLSDFFPEHMGGSAPVPAGTVLHLETADADAMWNSAIAAGATATMPLTNQFWGARYGQLKDPFGHTWSISGPVKA